MTDLFPYDVVLVGGKIFRVEDTVATYVLNEWGSWTPL